MFTYERQNTFIINNDIYVQGLADDNYFPSLSTMTLHWLTLIMYTDVEQCESEDWYVEWCVLISLAEICVYIHKL